MKCDLAIAGLGPVGAFGCGREALLAALADGRSPVGTTSLATPAGPVELPAFLADTASLERFVARRELRRIDHFSRMALLGAFLALEDAGMLGMERSRLGLVIASGYGAMRTTFTFLDSVFSGGDALASPTPFSNSVHNAAAAHVSMLLRAIGPSLTVSQFEMSVPSALLSAALWLVEERVDAVLFGGVDECGELLHYCWQRFFPAAGEARMQPLDFQRQSAVAGEGAAFMVLTRAADTIRPYARIRQVAQGNGAGVQPPLPQDAVLFLGADGHHRCGAAYGGLPAAAALAAYAPLYGSLPVGPAFDLTLAALSCRQGRLFPGPPGSCRGFDGAGETLAGRSICCLKYGSEGDYGLIRVES
ncbi:MAG: beta-ketoacyl synthase N-terminal-like domain-containing protein [Desulfuromonadaceae bacterium]